MFEKTTRQLAEEKLFVLFLCKNFNLSLSKNELTHVVMENNLIDFFPLQQYISELIEDEFLIEETSSVPERYSVSEKGEKILELFEKKMSYSKREQILNYIKSNREEIIKSQDIRSTYEKQDDDNYNVSLSLLNNGDSFFSISLKVPTVNMARQMCENWDSKYSEVYNSLTKILSEEK